jgi:copper chaperone CopZ
MISRSDLSQNYKNFILLVNDYFSFVEYLNLELMKSFRKIAFILFSAILLITISCKNKSEKSVKTDAEVPARMEILINGMTCTGCEQTIQNNVSKLDGIKSVKASFTLGNAIIEYLPGRADTVKIKETVNGSGYTFKKFIYLP